MHKSRDEICLIHFAFSGGAPEGASGEMDLLHSEEFRTGASGDAGESSNTPQEVHAFIAFLEKQQRSSRIDGVLADIKQLRELLATHATRSLDEILEKQGFPKQPAPAHGGNREVDPTSWGISVKQFETFIRACKATTEWAALRDEEQRQVWGPEDSPDYGKLLKPAGYVSGYQMDQSFVTPWTSGTGSSVSLLMNKQQPLEADFMISHAWSESMEEVLDAVEGDTKLTESTTVWFCMFAIFQNQPIDWGDASKGGKDISGPSILEQLALKPVPFEAVIGMALGMIVLHTTGHNSEPFSRLWCVSFALNLFTRIECVIL